MTDRSPVPTWLKKTREGVPVGSPATWHEVAALLTERLRRPIGPREAQKMGSEGPDGFYVKTEI